MSEDVKIKPLVWEYGHTTATARVAFGEYQIAEYTETDGTGYVLVFNDAGELGEFATTAGAEAAAQAHFEANILSALEPVPAPSGVEDDWRDDPSSDERWNAGVNYAIERLCDVFGIDPKSISWDAATETVDGDVSSVLCNVLVAAYGDEWSSQDRDTATIRSALTPLTQEPEPVAFVPVDATGQIHYIEIQTSLEHFASHWAEDGYTFKPLFATPIQAEPATGWVPKTNVRKAYDVLLAGGAPYTARECKVSVVLDDALHLASPTPPVENVGEVTDPTMRETMWAKVVYEGEDNTWLFELSEDSNRDGVHYSREIEFAADTFPEGTRIIVYEPDEDEAALSTMKGEKL